MLDIMNFITENSYVILTFICALILMTVKLVEFIGYPTEKKMEEIKERLLAYTAHAESELGSKTGRLKLSQVYDYFCNAFPYTKKWISFEKFSTLVDSVLPEMRKILEESSENK